MQKDGNENQKYHLDANNHVSSLTSVKPETKKLLSTNAELTELSEKIFAKENHSKLKNLHLDLQGKTEKYSKKDEAARPLFHPDDQALRSNSISKLLQLYDNYEPDTSIDEHFTPIQSKEENEFLDIVMVSGVMKEALSFLHSKGIVSSDPNEQKIQDQENLVQPIVKKSKKAGKFCSMLIGSSPELEMSLYTMCFLLRPNEVCPVTLGGQKVNIKTYMLKYKGEDLI
uniref:EndoU domain-containing protein n=1 Tax=Megaselia scalaris TaxID=36166 RepID=T1GPH6_MEGSC